MHCDYLVVLLHHVSLKTLPSFLDIGIKDVFMVAKIVKKKMYSLIRTKAFLKFLIAS